jgi:hypothetical protein
MSRLYYRRQMFRVICLILSLFILGIKLDVFWRKMLKEEFYLSEPLFNRKFKWSVMESENKPEKSVSIEYNTLKKRCAKFLSIFIHVTLM